MFHFRFQFVALLQDFGQGHTKGGGAKHHQNRIAVLDRIFARHVQLHGERHARMYFGCLCCIAVRQVSWNNLWAPNGSPSGCSASLMVLLMFLFLMKVVQFRYPERVARMRGKDTGDHFLRKTATYLRDNISDPRCLPVWMQKRMGALPPSDLIL